MNPELQTILEALNSVGSQAWEASVRYTYAVALSAAGVGAFFAAISAFATRKIFTLLAVKDPDELVPACCFVAVIAGIIGVAMLSCALPDIIEPTGATIKGMIRAVGK